MAASYLLIIGDREALAWVLRNQRMAFPAYRRQQTSALQPGDELLLYTTRGCFHNPTRDRGRVMGCAQVKTAAKPLPKPVRLSGREFSIGCALTVERLAPIHEGLEFPPLVPKLSTFPNKKGWATRLRRPLVALTREDAALLRRRLAPLLVPAVDAVDGYLSAANRPVYGQSAPCSQAAMFATVV